MEYVSEMLKMSVSGYNKIENNFNNISLAKLLEIQKVLDVPLNDLIEIKNGTYFNQTLKDNAVGYQQETQHLYQENKDIVNKLVKAYQDEIAYLRKQLELK